MNKFVTELTDENYNNFVSSGVVLVDVLASWCGPCRIIGPLVDQIAVEYENKVSVGKLDADNNRQTISILGVKSIPTLFIYKDGKVVDKLVGLVSKDKIVEKLNLHL